MDYIPILLGALGGAIGGAIGYLLSKNIANRTLQIAVMILAVVISGEVARSLSENQTVRGLLQTPSKFDLLAVEYQEVLQKAKGYDELTAGMTPVQTSSLIEQQTRLGLKRLSAEDLLEWNRLRSVLADGSEVLCAGFWTGKLTGPVIIQAIESLSEANMRAWFRISTEAARREIEQVAYPEVSPLTLQLGIQQITQPMTPEEQVRMSQVMVQGVRAENPEACWAIKVLLNRSDTLAASEREKFIRALAAL